MAVIARYELPNNVVAMISDDDMRPSNTPEAQRELSDAFWRAVRAINRRYKDGTMPEELRKQWEAITIPRAEWERRRQAALRQQQQEGGGGDG